MSDRDTPSRPGADGIGGLGRRIEQLRTITGLSQADFCRVTRLPRGAVWFFENGRHEDMAVSSLAKIARATGATTDWLLLEAGDPPTTEVVARALPRARLRAFREALGLEVLGVAARSGLRAERIGALEEAAEVSGPDEMARLALGLQVEPIQLAGVLDGTVSFDRLAKQKRRLREQSPLPAVA